MEKRFNGLRWYTENSQDGNFSLYMESEEREGEVYWIGDLKTEIEVKRFFDALPSEIFI